MAELTGNDHAELLVLYQVGVEDIEKAKQWAWNVTYQAVLAQGGVLALYTAYVASVPSAWVRLIFVALLLALTAVAHYALSDSVEALQTFRGRVRRWVQRCPSLPRRCLAVLQRNEPGLCVTWCGLRSALLRPCY